MRDIYTETVLEIAAYYDQSVYLGETKDLHPKVSAFKKWMLDNITEKDADAFKDRIFSKFKFFPKIAELNEAISDKRSVSFEIQAESAWQSLVNKSSFNDVLITDEASAYIVSGFGSWHDFCLERDDNREWTHKNFIQRYIAFKESGMNHKCGVLSGSMRHHYGSNFKGILTKIIGDETHGRKLLEDSSEKVQINNLISASLKRVK